MNTIVVALWAVLARAHTELVAFVLTPALVPGVRPVPTARCIPVNNKLSGLGSFLNQIAGAFGGLLEPAAITSTVLGGVILAIVAFTKDAPRWMKIVMLPFGAIILVAGLILIGTWIFKAVDSSCP